MKIILCIVLAALVQATSYNYPDNDRNLKSSAGGRSSGGLSSSRSSFGGSSFGGSSYKGYSSSGYSNAGYLTFGNYAYASYYAYAYYGTEGGRHDCWPADAECLEDARKRNVTTGIFTGCIIGAILLIIIVGVCYARCKENY